MPSSFPLPHAKSRLAIFLFLSFFILSAGVRQSVGKTVVAGVNNAQPQWGTAVSATSQFSEQYGAERLVDGSRSPGASWLSQDHAELPQTITFNFEKAFILTRVVVVQSNFHENMYRSKDFHLEASDDGV